LTAGRKAIEDLIGGSDEASEAVSESFREMDADARKAADAFVAAEGDLTQGVTRYEEAAKVSADATRALADEWAAAEGDISGALDAATEAAERNEAAVRGMNDAYREALALNGDIDAATDEFLDSVAELDANLQKATESARDDADAERNRGLVVRDAMNNGLALAQILEDQARAEIEATGATIDHNAATRLQNESLLRVASTVDGPVRDALLHHITSINNIPEDVATEIIPAVNAGDLATAEQILDDATRDRTLAIEPELTGEQEFENQLDHLTRERQMRIRGVLSGTVPLEGGSLHLTDLETGEEKGVVPDEHTLALQVDAGDALAKLAASRQAIADAEAAAREAGGEFTSALEVLEPALRDLDTAFSLGALNQQTYLEHLRAHQAGYEAFSVEWVEITQRILREEERINSERTRAAEEAARERQRVQEQEAAQRTRFTEQVRGEFAGAGDIVSEFAGAAPVTGAGIASFIAEEAARARKFAYLIGVLKTKNLSASVIEALVQAGPEATNVAFALSQASPAEIRRINAALFDLFKTGGATAASIGRLLGIPGFQAGGVFHAPTPGGAGLAVLHDGERVVPKDRAGRDTYNQTITINTRQTTDETIRQVRRYQRLNGEVRIS
jgi:hypothetical protein